MKKLSILATTTLAGTLLFAGAGSANAAENNSSNSQLQNTAKDYLNSHHVQINKNSELVVEDNDRVSGNVPKGYKPVMFGEQGNNGPSYILVNANGDVIDPQHREATPDQNQTSHQPTQNTSNQQQANANQTKETPTNANTQYKAASLPATGQETNTTLISSVATILLGLGSILTFKRFTKEK
ncbi:MULTISPECIES: LPXTG cell wall anchor domain-containing protein [Staphylococcus]|uniref:LPXTG cell wall anchor domain-containing protein n=1 Tax=Staphylococcus TaxID=1279 RepID=UPI0002463655|nr:MULTISPECIES: LPXTG cell wall anchor domain-containing protein [Staphylococcus]QAV30859.1 cell wall protein [Sulfitobacter donghicola]AGZ25729.1 hypothetical protein STP1_1430 [Staphylococcus pasteuri SP1]KAB7644635.1 LPXTG cell wall anchor domain-containing protein [Staphylococcus sp. B2-b]MBN6854091.1 LPXTG cell wall anchor domain-containing protein [Staphylococcus warneri]MBT2769907.1 LPXTG cell wall anchor domain-containing protein [Staphylococcus warneri]